MKNNKSLSPNLKTFVETHKTLNSILDDETFLGVFDADGSILICIDLKKKSSVSSKPFNLRIVYEFAQSNSKKDLVLKVANKFDGHVSSNSQKTTFRVTATTLVGEKIRQLLLKFNPKQPGRFYAFLLSEYILRLLKKKINQTKSGLICLIYLAYNNVKNRKKCYRKYPLTYWFQLIQPKKKDISKGVFQANLILKSIKKKTLTLEKNLLKEKFSLNYIRGAHFGDGSLMVSLTWKPNKSNRRRCVPEWTISGENKNYCYAFVNTLSGSINKSGLNCYKFKVYGIKNTQKILYIFENTWLPKYKKNQFEKFKKALFLLINKEHFTKKGTKQLVQLVYNMSEKGIRKYSQKQYIKWGIEWLKQKQYIK